MSTEISTNGVQYTDRYNSSVGYKCCTTVEHDIILTHNSSIKPTTVDIPQTDANCHILMMHLYNNDTLVNLCNVSSIEIKFICGDKTVIGDYRRLAIVNACKGIVSYLLDKDTTGHLGLNYIKLTLTIGTGTVTFDSTYNVVPNVQTDTTTIVLPDTCRDTEYVYGPYCRHTLSYKNSSTTDSADSDDDCNCDYNCPSCPVYPDDADNITLRELYFITERHINNKSLHLNNKRVETLNSCFKTVENYADLLNEITCSCSGDKIADGRLYRVNNVNGEVKYYYWDAASISFKETTFGSQGEPGRDADDITWNELCYGNEVKTTVGGLAQGTDISNLTITQILAKMLGIGKEVPVPIIENVESKTIPVDNTIVLSYPVTNLVSNLTNTIDLEKVLVTSDAIFSSNVMYDDVSDNIIITLSDLTADTVIDIVFNEGVVTQIGNPEYGYENETKYSEQKSCQIVIV